MGGLRRCSVKNCTSGTKRDRDERSRLGLRQITLFGVTPFNRLENWKTVFPYLKKNNCVCELHFKPCDISRVFYIHDTAGPLKQNVSLYKNAMPILEMPDLLNNKVAEEVVIGALSGNGMIHSSLHDDSTQSSLLSDKVVSSSLSAVQNNTSLMSVRTSAFMDETSVGSIISDHGSVSTQSAGSELSSLLWSFGSIGCSSTQLKSESSLHLQISGLTHESREESLFDVINTSQFDESRLSTSSDLEGGTSFYTQRRSACSTKQEYWDFTDEASLDSTILESESSGQLAGSGYSSTQQIFTSSSSLELSDHSYFKTRVESIMDVINATPLVGSMQSSMLSDEQGGTYFPAEQKSASLTLQTSASSYDTSFGSVTHVSYSSQSAGSQLSLPSLSFGSSGYFSEQPLSSSSFRISENPLTQPKRSASFDLQISDEPHESSAESIPEVINTRQFDESQLSAPSCTSEGIISFSTTQPRSACSSTKKSWNYTDGIMLDDLLYSTPVEVASLHQRKCFFPSSSVHSIEHQLGDESYADAEDFMVEMGITGHDLDDFLYSTEESTKISTLLRQYEPEDVSFTHISDFSISNGIVEESYQSVENSWESVLSESDDSDVDELPIKKPRMNSCDIDLDTFLTKDLSISSDIMEESYPSGENLWESILSDSDDFEVDELSIKKPRIISCETTNINLHRFQHKTEAAATSSLSKLTISNLVEFLSSCSLPEGWSWSRQYKTSEAVTYVDAVLFTEIKDSHVIRYFEVSSNLSVTIYTSDKLVSTLTDRIIRKEHEVLDVIRDFKAYVWCVGTEIDKSRSSKCEGAFLSVKCVRSNTNPKCSECRSFRKILMDRQRHKKDLTEKLNEKRKKIKAVGQKLKRKTKKLDKISSEIETERELFANQFDDALDEKLKELPEAQQLAVRACFQAANIAPTQRRYCLDWIYECLLMRIKSSRLYDHLRDKNILILPSRSTLEKYIQQVGSVYGFQESVFETLKLKSSRFEISQKHGTLTVDEMALSEAVAFNTANLEFQGFVDLGKHTTNAMKNERANHALVFMFQPFRGSWVQVLGAFLSKDCVTSDILHRLILECVVLTEKAGFKIDVITMDGAQWNRGVWTVFGVKDGSHGCEHPCDAARRLWFISDFPHLIKCLRNLLFNVKSFWTPWGIIKLAHWQAILDTENYSASNLKAAYKLTPDHLKPNNFQKMNVAMAFQTFSENVANTMELFMNIGVQALADALPTIRFIRLVSRLIDAMTSRSAVDALRIQEGSATRKAIIEFDQFLRLWEVEAREEEKTCPLSASTLTGFKVSLNSTLEILRYLHDSLCYEFLMTSRLSQDPLERFFGLIRSVCGCNDHPDPIIFIKVFKLLMCQSLLKVPRGSNVCGTEILHTLMSTKESLQDANARKLDYLNKLDDLMDNGEIQLEEEEGGGGGGEKNQNRDSLDHCVNLASNPNTKIAHLNEHDYDVQETSKYVMAYISGFVVRKAQTRLTTCQDCIKLLTSNVASERDRLIQISTRGALIIPSKRLFQLISLLENAALEVIAKIGLSKHFFESFLRKVEEICPLPLVGCTEHCIELSKKIINFYVVMRCNFASKNYNKRLDDKKKKKRLYKKLSKL